MDTSGRRPEVAGVAELNVSLSVIACRAESEIFGRYRWNMITPAKMIGETADWTLFKDPTKTSGAR